MARAQLKALSRQRLMYTDLPAFFDLLESESPRMSAILAAAGVEDGLEFAIESQHMRGLSKTDFGTIFDSDDMLGTFGAKIKMGHALRLYGDVTRADLNCIKDIRNVFAHAKVKLDFSHSLVIDACNQLQGPYDSYSLGTEDSKYWTARERYLKCTKYLYLEFLNLATEKIPKVERPPSSLP